MTALLASIGELPIWPVLYMVMKGFATMNTETKEHELRQTDTLEEQAGGGAESAQVDPEAALEQHKMTPAEFEELKAEAAKANENWEQMLRVAADFENFKKRAARERQEISKYANESLLEKLIPILDNFDMALAAAGSAQTNTAQSLQAGIAMIYQQLKNVLTEAGLQEIDASNQAFDPNWHEAVSQQESVEMPEGQVLQQLRKGYKLRDRLLRPAGVVVAKKPAG
jgi:molecular chaperone GrpE